MHTDTYRCGGGRKAYMGRRTGCTQTQASIENNSKKNDICTCAL